jgi:SAM-dependent methyltransferase
LEGARAELSLSACVLQLRIGKLFRRVCPHSMTDKPIALDAYETLAEAYAEAIDTKPHNAYYERPATLSLLPDVKNMRVLDAGCGPGIYSEWLIAHGARVLAIDASPKMVELAKRRNYCALDVRLADLSKPLPFLNDSSFDLVLSPLVLEYIEDWSVPLKEFYRALRPGGYLVCSVSHPSSDYFYFKSENYFETELVGSEWRGFGSVRVNMPCFRRSLEATLNPLLDAGFRLERVLEPKPTEQFKEADPRHYAELWQQPAFLCLRARK